MYSAEDRLTKTEKQQVFNTVILALNEQGRKSMMIKGPAVSGRCAYRGDNGAMCAIGHLIPDEAYSTEMDAGVGGKLTSVLFCISEEGKLDTGPFSPLTRKTLTTANLEFLEELQLMHDTIRPLLFYTDLATSAAALSGIHGLTLPEEIRCHLAFAPKPRRPR